MTKFDLTNADLFEVDTTQAGSDKPEIDLLRPSSKDRHSVAEWQDFFYEREKQSDKEMFALKKRLGEYTLRYMCEALMGEEATHRLLGVSGGEVEINQLKLDKRVFDAIIAEIAPTELPKLVRDVHLLPPDDSDEPVRVVDERVVEKPPIRATDNLFDKLSPEVKQELLKALIENIDGDTLKRLLLGGK